MCDQYQRCDQLQLTRGALENILDGANLKEPVFRVLSTKLLDICGSKRYRLQISDGQNFGPCVTGKTMNFIFSLKEMKMLKLSVIKLKEYSCTTICGRKIIILEDVVILVDGLNVNDVIHVPSALHIEKMGFKILHISLTDKILSKINKNVRALHEEEECDRSSLSETEANGDADICGKYVYSVCKLRPILKEWVIRVQVEWAVYRPWKSSKMKHILELKLMDFSAGIRAIAFDSDAAKFRGMIEIGEIYYITSGYIQKARFPEKINHEFEIVLKSYSKVKLCTDGVYDSFIRSSLDNSGSVADPTDLEDSDETPKYSLDSKKYLVQQHLPKSRVGNLDYNSYCKSIEFILLTGSDFEYSAAMTYLKRPSIEDHTATTATIFRRNILVGSFAGAQVALVKTGTGRSMKAVMAKVMKHFKHAKYFISLGGLYGFHQKEVELGDVVISSAFTNITDYNIHTDKSIVINGTINETCDLLQRIFCIDSSVKNFKVSSIRSASYHESNVISSDSMVNDFRLHDKTSITVVIQDSNSHSKTRIAVQSCGIGGNTDSEELLKLRMEGEINEFILIKSVIGYVDGIKTDTWKFTGAMAALHYVEQKMIPYINHKDSVDNYMSALKSDKENIIDVMAAKLVFLGPSMQGKTVTRQRLTKSMVNIKSNSLDKSNTGVSEQSTVIICKDSVCTAVLAKNDEDWKVINIGEECQFFLNTRDTTTAVSEVSLHSVPTCCEEEVENRPSTKRPKLTLTSEEKSWVQTITEGQPKQEGVRQNEQAASTELSASTVEWTQKIIRNTLERNHFDSLKERLKGLNGGYLLYMQDTGGQPELMDCLPALTIGPALYLLFCKLDSSLDDHYKIGYRGPDGNTLPIQSHFTVKEILLTALASIDSMSYLSTDLSANHGEQMKNRKECVYFVGTHKDLVDNKTIDIFDSDLQELLQSTVFYEKGLVKCWYETDLPSESSFSHNEMDLHPESSLNYNVPERLIYPLDNMDGIDKEIQSLRTSIQNQLNSLFESKKIPSHWLVFGFCLRSLDESVVTLTSCFELGAQLKMSEEDTKSALHILHYDLGICMHFSNVPSLKNIVITKTQAVYKGLTALIEAAFKPGRIESAAAKIFKNSGQFSIETFKNSSDYILPLETLVQILEHLNIVAPVCQEESVFFMPCILQNASDEDIAKYEKENPIPEYLSPLFVRYKCGLVPLGVFSAMIAYLLHPVSYKKSEHITLKRSNLRRNHVQFYYGEERDILTFVRKPEFIRIHISRQLNCDERSLPQVCLKIKSLVKETLRNVIARMLHSLYATSKKQDQCLFEPYQFAFKCYKHSGCEHLCVVSYKDKDPKYMDCIKDGSNEPVLMQSGHLVWFGKEIPKSHTSKDNPTLTRELNIADDFFTVHEYLLDAKVKWYIIGMGLKVNIEDLDAIEATKANMDDRLLEMIKIWLQKGKNKTWQTIIAALETKAVGRLDVAEKIKEKSHSVIANLD